MEQLDVVQYYKSDTNYQEEPLDNNKKTTTETSDAEDKERQNTNTIPRSANSGKVVEFLEMKFRGNKYDTQFTNT